MTASTWALGVMWCDDCGHEHVAIVEEQAGVPFLVGAECSACRNMHCRWLDKPVRYESEQAARDATKER